VIVVAALARLAKTVRLSRYFRLLLAALACPYALVLASQAFRWPWFYLTFHEWQALLSAGPVLTATMQQLASASHAERRFVRRADPAKLLLASCLRSLTGAVCVGCRCLPGSGSAAGRLAGW
jgi:hypothetical protein